MKWYYAAGGNQVGPIDETELNRLVTMGTVRADTLVWHDGLASWQPLGVVRGMAPAAAGLAGGTTADSGFVSWRSSSMDYTGRGQCDCGDSAHADVRQAEWHAGLGGARRGMIFGPAMAGVFGISR